MHALYLFQVLSTVQQSRLNGTLSVRKVAPWRNSLLQKFGNDMLYCLIFTPDASIYFRVFGWSSEEILILMKTKPPFHIMVLGVVTTEDDIMLSFIWPKTQQEDRYQVSEVGSALLDRWDGCWKNLHQAMPHKQENPVLPVKKFLKLHHS